MNYEEIKGGVLMNYRIFISLILAMSINTQAMSYFKGLNTLKSRFFKETPYVPDHLKYVKSVPIHNQTQSQAHLNHLQLDTRKQENAIFLKGEALAVEHWELGRPYSHPDQQLFSSIMRNANKKRRSASRYLYFCLSWAQWHDASISGY